MVFTVLSEGMRLFFRSLAVRGKGFKEYPGDDVAICKAIIEDCWNEKKGFFKTSAGHFNCFYSRDFSWCVKHLLSLGHRQRVRSTILYALTCFQAHGRIRVGISSQGKPFDFPAYSIDSLPSLMRTLRIFGSKKIVADHKEFLEKETAYLYREAIDKDTGLVRKDKFFSSIKDHAKRKSSCYDNCMIGMLSQDLDHFKLKNPFCKEDHAYLIKKHFWNKSYFLNDLSGSTAITGDSNVFPFWTGIVKDKEKALLAFRTLRLERLDKPFPLKYHQKDKPHAMGFPSFLAQDYETDSIWPHIALLLIEVMMPIDKQKSRNYLQSYFEKIILNKNFLEIYDRHGNPYKTPLYITDEAMLWSSIYLGLINKIKL